MPYNAEHSCRIKNPDLFQQDSFRRMDKEDNGKKFSMIMGKLKGEDTMTVQAYRYPKDVWTVEEARAKCKEHKGISFEPAKDENSANKQIEKRIFNLSEIKIEKRGDSNQPIISGHAAVFNQLTDIWRWRERIAPGAFTKTLKTSDTRALFNHDSNWILGRSTSGTLKMSEDDTGLAVEISPPDTQLIRDMVITPMERGDLNQMSFAFMVTDEVWEDKKDEMPIRTIKEVDPLYDVSVVTFPAYPTTDAKIRDIFSQSGIDYDSLSNMIFRAKQGLPLQRQDLDLINASIEVLKNYIPIPPVIVTDEPEDEAPKRLLILRKRLELIEKGF